MLKKKILITGGRGMLAYDFYRTQKEKYEVILVDKNECDITSFESVMQCIALHSPDILLNCAAYTRVDDAEDIGMKICFDVNTLGVKNLAKATSVFGVAFITISTDYVFDGAKAEGYLPSDEPNPIGIYGMSKYLGEQLAMDENPRTIIVRTSWLYGWEIWMFHNFVNTMLKLSETRTELKVVADQHGIPTSCIDLSSAISDLIDRLDDIFTAENRIFHFSSACEGRSITWADFAREILRISKSSTTIINCTSEQYLTKAKRPEYSILQNDSGIVLPDWTQWIWEYLGK